MLRASRSKQHGHGMVKSWAMALALVCASLTAHGLTLGHFSVESGLGEPLRAAIEVTNYKVEDLRRLKVQLAEPASFEQAGMAFHPALSGLQTRLEFRGDGKPFIALSGQTPVNEHFLDVIVEAQWPSGKLAMNYTLLVSPVGAGKPVFEKTQATDTVSAPVVSGQDLTAVVVPVAGPDGAAAAQAISVRAGDTASRLVLQQMPAGVSLDQMLLAMVRANPQAFIEGNVNLLREGAQVQLPSAQEAAQIPADEARQTVITQTVDFTAYARRLAQAALKAPETASRYMTGKLSPEVTSPALPQPAQDKLTLSKREVTPDSAEARLAVEREIQDKTEQLAALKKNLETLTSLSATPDAKQSSPTEPAVLAPSLPIAATETRSWLDAMGRTPSLWAWLMALLASMAALVWMVRRRPAAQTDLFDTHPQQAPSLAPVLAPFASGLPPQFAGLDLNLTPAPGAQSAPEAAQPAGPKT